MKKIALVALLVALAAGPAVAQSTLKIGVFDPIRVSEETEEGRRVQTHLRTFLESKQQGLEALETEINGLREQLQAQALSLSEDKRADLEKSIQLKVLEFNGTQESAQREWALERNEAQGRFEQQLIAVIQQFGQREGFDLLLDRSQVAYAAPTTDVTTALVDLFNTTVVSPAGSE